MSKNKTITKGYKQTEVGIIPEDWKVVQLGDVVSQKIRAIDKPSKPYWKLGLRSHAKGTFHTYIDDPKKISMKKLYLVKENDLIVSITFAWEHAIALANQKDIGKLVSHRFPTYKLNNLADPIFYKYYILQTQFKYLLQNISPGGAGRNRVMNKKDFLLLKILLPPRPEQQKIANILTTWDKAIEKQTTLITQKQRLKKGLMQRLFSQTIRFKNDSGNNFPDWQKKKLEELGNIKKGTQLNKDELTKEGKYPAINGGKNPSGYTGKWNTKKNTITISEGGNSCGYINLIDSKFWSGSHCYAISELRINILNTFFFQILKYNEQLIMNLRVGSGLPNIQKGAISSFKIDLPVLLEQKKITKILSFAGNEIIHLQTELALLESQKKGLMQQLLTGKIRVKL